MTDLLSHLAQNLCSEIGLLNSAFAILLNSIGCEREEAINALLHHYSDIRSNGDAIIVNLIKLLSRGEINTEETSYMLPKRGEKIETIILAHKLYIGDLTETINGWTREGKLSPDPYWWCWDGN